MRSFKKIAAMIMAVAMLCSFTALANAVVELEPITDPTPENPKVTLGYTDNTTAVQRTMLVYKGDRNLAGADVVYINQFAEDADPVELNLEGSETATYTVVAGGMDADQADTETFTYTALAYNVTLTKGEHGFVKTEGADFSTSPTVAVNKDEVIKFTFLPHVGYVPSVTVNNVDFSVNEMNELSLKVDGDKDIVVEFIEAEATTIQSFSGAEIHTIRGNEAAEYKADKYESKLMFGKAVAPAGETITEAGMYLEKWYDAEGETPAGFREYTSERTNDAVKGYFKADNMVGGKYGIRFIRFNAGKYRVRSYVKYVKDGEDKMETGIPVEFEVE